MGKQIKMQGKGGEEGEGGEKEEKEKTASIILQEGYTVDKSSKADLLMQSLIRTYVSFDLDFGFDLGFVLTDPRMEGNPIVYASRGFLEATGYHAEEVLGRNFQLLEGPRTCRQGLLRIREAVREEKPCLVPLLGYAKSGLSFWSLLHIAPVFSNQDGGVLHFVIVQTPLASTYHTSSSSSSTTKPLSGVSLGASVATSSGELYNRRKYQSHNSSLPSNWEEEETCKIEDTDKQNSIMAMCSILCKLVKSSKGKGSGVAVTRCTADTAFSGGERMLCSSLTLALTRIQQSFVLANPDLPDMPIVYASDAFLHLTGYSRNDVVGRNCRFLQGPGSDPLVVQQIRDCIKAEQCCSLRILNYRKDGTPFLNLLHVAPVRNATGRVAFYVGVQLDVTNVDENECKGNDMSPRMKQMGTVGAVRVAVRSSQIRPHH
uniref:Putative LOV domain-containing protein n=1 Tax=Equisetum hyemale TaxID=3262 RepID=A0A126WYM7_EQUHY|nr:putative LOV domain-containing protein [Equisetum hyemale]